MAESSTPAATGSSPARVARAPRARVTSTLLGLALDMRLGAFPDGAEQATLGLETLGSAVTAEIQAEEMLERTFSITQQQYARQEGGTHQQQLQLLLLDQAFPDDAEQATLGLETLGPVVTAEIQAEKMLERTGDPSPITRRSRRAPKQKTSRAHGSGAGKGKNPAPMKRPSSELSSDKTWHCELCGRTMQLIQMERHCSGRARPRWVRQ